MSLEKLDEVIGDLEVQSETLKKYNEAYSKIVKISESISYSNSILEEAYLNLNESSKNVTEKLDEMNLNLKEIEMAIQTSIIEQNEKLKESMSEDFYKQINQVLELSDNNQKKLENEVNKLNKIQVYSLVMNMSIIFLLIMILVLFK